jgi:hypothetical protein
MGILKHIHDNKTVHVTATPVQMTVGVGLGIFGLWMLYEAGKQTGATETRKVYDTLHRASGDVPEIEPPLASVGGEKVGAVHPKMGGRGRGSRMTGTGIGDRTMDDYTFDSPSSQVLNWNRWP